MKVLFLSTWFPYPLSQGCKIRAYHLLKALAQNHEVALVSFEDVPLQPAWLDEIGGMCKWVEVVRCDPFAYSRFKSLLGWLSWYPSAVLASYSREMMRRVQDIARRWNPERVVAMTYVTAPYAAALQGIPKLIDVDNLMTRMMHEAYQAGLLRSEPLPKRARSWLAWRKFALYERSLYRKFDRCLVVSAQDRQTLQEVLRGNGAQVGVTPNGVDLLTHTPGLYAPQPNTLIFNGALTYAANFRAMQYFLSDIYPIVRSHIPQVLLRITGSTQGVPLDQLPSLINVRLTGFLDDVRPAVASSWVCVVPLREGGGTRLKILEAMALGTPVVSTSKGAEGLEVESGKHLLIADDPGEFASCILDLLLEPELRRRLAGNAYDLVREKYDWQKIGLDFCSLVEVLPS